MIQKEYTSTYIHNVKVTLNCCDEHAHVSECEKRQTLGMKKTEPKMMSF